MLALPKRKRRSRKRDHGQKEDAAMSDRLVKSLNESDARFHQRVGGTESIISFLQKDPWTFRSGYAKADLIKLLIKIPLKENQGERLRKVVIDAVDRRDRREFRHYCRLAFKVDSPKLRSQLALRLGSDDPGIRRRAKWVLDYLRLREAQSKRK